MPAAGRASTCGANCRRPSMRAAAGGGATPTLRRHHGAASHSSTLDASRCPARRAVGCAGSTLQLHVLRARLSLAGRAGERRSTPRAL